MCGTAKWMWPACQWPTRTVMVNRMAGLQKSIVTQSSIQTIKPQCVQKAFKRLQKRKTAPNAGQGKSKTEKRGLMAFKIENSK
jgi:hypothetical protein